MKRYAYYENGKKEVFTESELKQYFDNCDDLQEQKEEGTTFEDWIQENISMQIYNIVK
jgi:hypothetical protein